MRAACRLAAHDREAAELRAAFEAEKRITDTLQEAFVLEALPAYSKMRDTCGLPISTAARRAFVWASARTRNASAGTLESA